MSELSLSLCVRRVWGQQSFSAATCSAYGCIDPGTVKIVKRTKPTTVTQLDLHKAMRKTNNSMQLL